MDFSAWWETLDAASKAFYGTCFWVSAVLGFIEIRHRIKRNRLGEDAPPKKNRFSQVFWGTVVVWVLYLLRNRVPLIDLIIGLPGRIWSGFDEHSGAVYFGFLAGMVVATTAASIYAALFIRKPAPSVAIQPGFAGASVTVVSQTRTIYEEEE